MARRKRAELGQRRSKPLLISPKPQLGAGPKAAAGASLGRVLMICHCCVAAQKSEQFGRAAGDISFARPFDSIQLHWSRPAGRASERANIISPGRFGLLGGAPLARALAPSASNISAPAGAQVAAARLQLVGRQRVRLDGRCLHSAPLSSDFVGRQFFPSAAALTLQVVCAPSRQQIAQMAGRRASSPGGARVRARLRQSSCERARFERRPNRSVQKVDLVSELFIEHLLLLLFRCSLLHSKARRLSISVCFDCAASREPRERRRKERRPLESNSRNARQLID